MRSKVAQLNFQFLSGNYPEYRVTFNLRLILSLSHGNNDPGRSSGFQPASLTLSLRKQSAPGRNLSSDYRRYVCHAIRSYLEGIHCEITVGISQTDFVTRIHPNPSSSSLGVPRFYFLFFLFFFFSVLPFVARLLNSGSRSTNFRRKAGSCTRFPSLSRKIS